MRTVSGRDEVAAILSDPAYVVPPVPPAGPVGTLAWLRATVCRFAEGEPHARRRALVEARIAALDLDRLRALARGGASPVQALAAELGIAPDVEEAVATVAAVYLTGDPSPEADAAVAALVEAAGPGDEEAVAQDIAILVQAARATATLIERARAAEGPAGAGGADARVRAALGAAPPVPSTRRVGPAGPVVLDLSGLPFGAGRHGCPGEQVALALAAGALESGPA